MRTGRHIVVGALAAAWALHPAAAAPAATWPVGRWLTEDARAVVEIGRCGGALCGVVRQILKPGPNGETTDRRNPDPALRDRPIEGLTILSGFQPGSSGWRGSIYDPQSGKTYASTLGADKDGTLRVRGCVLFLCRTQTWRRQR